MHLDHIAVNLECPKNPLIADVKDFVEPSHFYSSIIPSKEFFATGRHFFVRPDEDGEEGYNDSRLVMNDEILKSNEYAASAVKKIRAGYTYDKELELEEKLRMLSLESAERDGYPDDSNVVNRKDFEYLLKSEFKLTGREVQNLLELITPSFEDNINFKSFFSFLRKGQNFEDSFKQQQQEETEEDENRFENTFKRDTREMNIHGLLKSQFNKENNLRTFPLKVNEYDREFLRERFDYLNIKSGMDGYIDYDDVVLTFVKSKINCSNEEIKAFLDSISKEYKRSRTIAGIEEVQFEVDYLKSVFDLV